MATKIKSHKIQKLPIRSKKHRSRDKNHKSRSHRKSRRRSRKGRSHRKSRRKYRVIQRVGIKGNGADTRRRVFRTFVVNDDLRLANLYTQLTFVPNPPFATPVTDIIRMITNLAAEGLPRDLNNPARFQQPPGATGGMMCKQFPNRFVYDDLHWTTSWKQIPGEPAHPLYGKYKPRPHITLSIILPAAAGDAPAATTRPDRRIILRIHYGYTHINEPNPIFWASVSRDYVDICKSEKGNHTAASRPDLIGTIPNLWRPATLHFVSFCLLTGRPPPKYGSTNYPLRNENTWGWGVPPTDPLRVRARTVTNELFDRLHFIYTTIMNGMRRELPPTGVARGQLSGIDPYTSLFLNGSSFPEDNMSGIQTVTAGARAGAKPAVINPLSLAHIDFSTKYDNIDQAIQLCWDVYHFIRQGNAMIIHDIWNKLMINPNGNLILRAAARQINIEPEFENGTSEFVSEPNKRRILITAMNNMLDPIQRFAHQPVLTRTTANTVATQQNIDRFLAMVGYEHIPIPAGAAGFTIVDHPDSGLASAINTVRRENDDFVKQQIADALRLHQRRSKIHQQNQPVPDHHMREVVTQVRPSVTRSGKDILRRIRRSKLRQKASTAVASARASRDAADQEACGDTCRDFEEWVADEDADKAERWEAGNAFWRHVNTVGGVRGQQLKEQICKGKK